MKRYYVQLLTILLVSVFQLMPFGLAAQDEEGTDEQIETIDDDAAAAAADSLITPTDTTYWRTSFRTGLNFTQASFSSNWTGGSVNSIAFGGLLNAKAHYEKDKVDFLNELDVQYGIVRNEGQSMRKSVDRLLFDSKVGYRLSEKWDMFASVNFLTQLYKGYEYQPDDQRNLISNFMSPGFLTGSWGMEYKPVDYFWLRLSPLSPRLTFVTDTTLYQQVPKNYGVDIGSRVRTEWLAFQVVADFDKNINDNFNVKARYFMFANYERFRWQEFDHRLEMILTAKITQLINVNFSTTLLYDFDQSDDVQLSQLVAIGFQFSIQNR